MIYFIIIIHTKRIQIQII